MINITVTVVSVKSVNLLAKVQDKFHKKWLSVNESDLLVEARIIVSHFNLTMKPSEVATTLVAVPLLTVFSQQIILMIAFSDQLSNDIQAGKPKKSNANELK